MPKLKRRARLPVRLRTAPYYLGAMIVSLTTVLFLASELIRETDDSWLILTGSKRPNGDTWYEEMVTGSLALMGYILLPAVIGLCVHSGLNHWMNARRQSINDVMARLDRRLQNSMEIDLRDLHVDRPEREARASR